MEYRTHENLKTLREEMQKLFKEETRLMREEQKKNWLALEQEMTMKIYEMEAVSIEIDKKLENITSIKYQLEKSLEAFENNARGHFIEAFLVFYDF